MNEEYELTDKQKKEIDNLFQNYKTKEELLEELNKYAFPDGSWSLYIRWRLDTLL